MKSFKLSNGYELPIVDGWREQIKSNWRKAYKEFEYSPIPIEKANKLLMPALFILLVTLLFYSFGMEGSGRAFKFIFEPRFSSLKIESVLEAMGQAFFSLSLGMGVMITYGSYLKRDSKIFNNSIIII